jgi:hypothetical protein
MKGGLMSIEIHGWLGNYAYKIRGVNPNPYPIGLLGFIRIPYSNWAKNIHGPYRIPAFGLRPYPAFISQYYSHLGWCYQRRRTWHGIIYTPIHPPISAHINTALRAPQKLRFAAAVAAWQILSGPEKAYWEAQRYPVHASGYNRFIRNYILTHAVPVIGGSAILQETGDKILTENSDTIVYEQAPF